MAHRLHCPTACGFLVPPTGIQPLSPASEGRILFFYLLIYLLAVLGLRCHVGFSLVVVSGGYFLVAVWWLFNAVTSLFAEHRL